MTRRPIVIGNWKMNGLGASKREVEALIAEMAKKTPACEVMVCPPATLIAEFAKTAAGSPVMVGGQDCHAQESGAHTGDIAAEMLADAGASAVIVGHSERRADHGESDDIVRAKAEATGRAGLTAIICIGETEEERVSGKTEAVLARQIAGSIPDGAAAAATIVAYEPVWAIGTGRTPSLEDIAAAHGFIRQCLGDKLGRGEAEAMRILYGGSVKPGNAGEILPLDGVDGALVGGASLRAGDFFAIVSACPA